MWSTEKVGEEGATVHIFNLNEYFVAAIRFVKCKISDFWF